MRLLASLPHELLSVGMPGCLQRPQGQVFVPHDHKMPGAPGRKLQHKAQPPHLEAQARLQPALPEGPGHRFPFGTLENCEMASG